ncbi:MAG: Mrp/NBP35 family ATP-binding protein [Phycisphaerales bacterium]|nr:Mrp/NBP35 family ATP-binding protein [Phycisphaerales bacterium]
MALSDSMLLDALSCVPSPDSRGDIVSLGRVRRFHINGTDVCVELEDDANANMAEAMIQSVSEAIRQAAEDLGQEPPTVSVDIVKTSESERREVLPGVRHVIAVGAGKGGVGKSTVSTLLALGLTRRGASCGLLDGDIYGPSMSTMLGLDDIETTARGNTLLPFDVHGLRSMTIGKLVDPDKPMIWRGPMAHKAFSQLLLQTDWGELDYLIVDLPPGTGDVPLSLAQALPLSGSVIVCTPQRVALDDARRAVGMFGELGIPILGIVENMSWFIADDGREYDLFGRGGAVGMAEDMGLPFLGPLPLHVDMRKHADAGTPLQNFDICDDVTDAIDYLASTLVKQVAVQSSRASDAPGISMS